LAIDHSFSATSEYFDVFLKAMESGEIDKQTGFSIMKDMVGGDLRGVFNSLVDIDNLHKEVSAILKEFSGTGVGLGGQFFKVLTIDHLILTIKFYIISWATITDMIASLINEVFNLGFQDQDVKLDLVLRNKHVRKSNVSAIFDRHRNTISFSRLKKHRNAIVHRGRIIDEDVIALRKELNSLYSKKYSLLSQANIADDDFQREIAKFNKKLNDAASQKQAYYEAHYSETLKMISEILKELGQKTLEIYKNKAS